MIIMDSKLETWNEYHEQLKNHNNSLKKLLRQRFDT